MKGSELVLRNRSNLILLTAVCWALLGATGVQALGDDDPWMDGIYFNGYADILYSHFNFGPDQKSGANGSPEDDRAIVDLQRFVLGLGYDFDESLTFQVEIEFEHGGAGGAMELEYEEFGEYELEIEKGGEVVLEQFHLTKTFNDEFNLRAGHIIVPVGGLNNAHMPLDHFGTVRPEAETSIIPTTWHETGLELFGDVSDFTYHLLLVNGLDSTGFSSKYWIRDGHQGRFEQTRATDLAWAGRLTYNGIRGLAASLSGYYGNTTGNRPKPDMKDIDAAVTIFGVDFRYGSGPLRVRGSYLMGDLQNADLITAKNQRLSYNLGVARTPVADAAKSFGFETGYDILPFVGGPEGHALLPFVRYEQVNSMDDTASHIFADPRFDRRIITVGFNWFPRPTVAVKGDYSIRSFGADRYRDEKTLGLSLGLVF